MVSARFSVLAAAAVAMGLAAVATPANAEFFGCNTPKVRVYSGTPWSHYGTARQSYASASYRSTRPVYHATRHSYRTQW